jgi:hypothetical protein
MAQSNPRSTLTIRLLTSRVAVTSIDKTLHHNLRRVFRSGVGADALAQYEPAILRNLTIYFSEITKARQPDGWTTAADMRKWSMSGYPLINLIDRSLTSAL